MYSTILKYIFAYSLRTPPYMDALCMDCICSPFPSSPPGHPTITSPSQISILRIFFLSNEFNSFCSYVYGYKDIPEHWRPTRGCISVFNNVLINKNTTFKVPKGSTDRICGLLLLFCKFYFPVVVLSYTVTKHSYMFRFLQCTGDFISRKAYQRQYWVNWPVPDISI